MSTCWADAYELAKKYGKDSLIVIETLGTNVLPYLFGMKATTERILDHIPTFKPYFPDRVLQHMGQLFPNQLPKRIEDYSKRYDHYLQLKMEGDGIDEARAFLKEFFATEDGDYLELDDKEAERIATHRYVTAGVAIRYEEVFQDDHIEILPLDIACHVTSSSGSRNCQKKLKIKFNTSSTMVTSSTTSCTKTTF